MSDSSLFQGRNRYLTGLDLLRLLLCIAVVYYHYNAPRPSSGPVAVIGFFVLSGFLSAYTLAGSPFDSQKFFCGKARRLLPTFISSSLLALVLLVVRLFFTPRFPTMYHAFGSVWNTMKADHFVWHNITDIFNVPAWYMYCEAACLVMLPLFLAAYRRKSIFALLFFFFLGAATLDFSQVPWEEPFGGGLYFSPFYRLWQFMAGMACFWLLKLQFPRFLRLTMIGLFLFVLTASLLLRQVEDLHLINYTFPFDLLVTCMYVLLIPILARMELTQFKRRKGLFSPTSIAWAASLTYGVFLIHVPVRTFLEFLHPQYVLFKGETGLTAAAITILLAIANKRWVEDRWLRSQRKQPSSTPESSRQPLEQLSQAGSGND